MSRPAEPTAGAGSVNREQVDLTPNPLTRGLRRNPRVPNKSVRFTGYLGESDRPDHVRLYLDPELRSWIEVARRDVRHREALEKGPQTLDVTVLWVKQSAVVGQGEISAKQMQAELLKGELIEHYLPESVSDDFVQACFTTTLICATISITWTLCVTPSCEDISVPLICDDEDDRDDDDDDDGDDDDDDDDDDGDGEGPDEPGDGDEPDTDTPTG